MLGFCPNLLPLTSENARQVRRSLSDFPHKKYVVCGPVGSSKTTMILSWIFAVAATQPNLRIAIARNERATLYTTLIPTLRKMLKNRLRNSPDSCFQVLGGETKPSGVQFASGSTIHFMGLEGPKLFGSDFDLIMINEIRLADEDVIADATARIRNGGVWGRDGQRHHMLLADTNAGGARSWVKRQAEDGQLLMVNTNLHDNPFYSQGGELTEEGQDYWDTLQFAYSGHAYRRYILNEWVDFEGLVYSDVFDYDTMVKPIRRADIPPRWWWSISIDHSYAGACAAVLYANSPKNNESICYKAVYKTERTTGQLLLDIERMLIGEGLTKKQIKVIVADHAPAANKEIEDAGYKVEKAQKAVESGIESMKSWILRGALRFNADILSHAPDQKLKQKGLCLHPYDEFASYAYADGGSELNKPKKGFDDYLDATRYHLQMLATRVEYIPYVPIGAAKRMPDALNDTALDWAKHSALG